MLFSIFRRRPQAEPEEPPPPPAPPPAGPSPAALSPLLLEAMPALDDVINQMLADLAPYLPPTPPTLPPAHIAVVEATPRPVAIGNLRGLDMRGRMEVAELKGGRLDARLRVQLWSDSLTAVDILINDLQANLLAGRDDLFLAGFLKLEGTGGDPAEHVDAIPGWRKTAEYRVLYEYHFSDNESAGSLITQIPVEQTGEVTESMLITGRVARWDELTAPDLVLAGSATITSLELLAYIPTATPGAGVTLRRTHHGASGPPTSFATVADFFNGVAAGERHAEVLFATLADFLAVFTPVGDSLTLGDVEEDTVPDEYQYHTLEVFPPLELTRPDDRLEVVYGAANFDVVAVLYIQLV